MFSFFFPVVGDYRGHLSQLENTVTEAQIRQLYCLIERRSNVGENLDFTQGNVANH